MGDLGDYGRTAHGLTAIYMQLVVGSGPIWTVGNLILPLIGCVLFRVTNIHSNPFTAARIEMLLC